MSGEREAQELENMVKMMSATMFSLFSSPPRRHYGRLCS
jgi:hypothetical protein